MSLLMDALNPSPASTASNLRLTDEAPLPTSRPDEPLSFAPLAAEPGSDTSPRPTRRFAAVDAASGATGHISPALPGTAATPPGCSIVVGKDSRRHGQRWLFLIAALGAVTTGGATTYFLHQPSAAPGIAVTALPGHAGEISSTAATSGNVPTATNTIAAVPLPPAPVNFAPPAPLTAAFAEAPTDTAATAAPAIENAPPPSRQVRREAPRLAPDPHLVDGHAKLQSYAFAEAAVHYRQALDSDPHNVDALLALAAIAQHQGRPGEAEAFHQRALAAAPQDPAALAASLGSTTVSDLRTAESRLKSLLAAQPETPALNFSLGNLYARQNRWPEAQQAYFNAVASDGDNPDYLFNLAVSLEHLRQPGQASRHYQLALVAARLRAAAFDPAQAERRLNQLPQP